MAGTLYVVATPIGNLEDITFRALRVLREVAVVAAEDTRRTGLLLQHFQIRSRLMSLHRHNEGLRVAAVLGCLGRGESVALVTDAGTPAVSDPGASVVRAAVGAGFRVEPVPGPSAVVSALSVAGTEADGFVFLGFPPIRAKNRQLWMEKLRSAVGIGDVVFFEAPHRIVRTVGELDVLGFGQLVVLRELTKIHESSYRGSPTEVLAQLTTEAGEFTVVVPQGSLGPAVESAVSDDEVLRMFSQTTELKTRAAAKAVAAKTGRSANEVYALVRRARGLTGTPPGTEITREQ
jgi:16S rRNA (cytidine1402-2'-O)-methyltransferase